jgi:hypothetical protein
MQIQAKCYNICKYYKLCKNAAAVQISGVIMGFKIESGKCKLPVEFSDNGRVVAGPFLFAGFFIDIAGGAFLGERFCCEDVV